MAKTVNVHEAKTHLSRLLAEVERGEEVIIARGGTPVARLLPAEAPRAPREPGSAKGQIWIAEDFDELPDELREFFE